MKRVVCWLIGHNKTLAQHVSFPTVNGKMMIQEHPPTMYCLRCERPVK